MVLMSLASALCQPLLRKRRWCASRSGVACNPLRGHPRHCHSSLTSTAAMAGKSKRCGGLGFRRRLPIQLPRTGELTSRLVSICRPKASPGLICSPQANYVIACASVTLTLASCDPRTHESHILCYESSLKPLGVYVQAAAVQYLLVDNTCRGAEKLAQPSYHSRAFFCLHVHKHAFCQHISGQLRVKAGSQEGSFHPIHISQVCWNDTQCLCLDLSLAWT